MDFQDISVSSTTVNVGEPITFTFVIFDPGIQDQNLELILDNSGQAIQPSRTNLS